MWIDQKIGLSISSRLRIKVMPKIEKSAVAGIIIIIIWMVAPRTTTPILKCSKKIFRTYYRPGEMQVLEAAAANLCKILPP